MRRFGYVAAIRGEESYPWEPAYSTVRGVLPRSDLTAFETLGAPVRMALARCEVEVTMPGAIALKLNVPSELVEIWVDGEEIEGPAAGEPFDLTAGIHALTFALRVDSIEEELRCELLDVPGSHARARFVLGK